MYRLFMEVLKKGTKVKKIFDEENPELRGYAVFEDNWITEFDEVLINKGGDMFLVLDFQEVIEKVLTVYISPFNTRLEG